MKLDWILGKKLIKLGFHLTEEEDFLYLTCNGEQAAVFASSSATVQGIQQAAEAWLQEHDKEPG